MGDTDGWDSVVGREGQRGVDEWVFFDNRQLMACFLVDQLGVIPAKEALHIALKALHKPWDDSVETAAEPDSPTAVSQDVRGGEQTSTGRWNRRSKDGPSDPPDAASIACTELAGT